MVHLLSRVFTDLEQLEGRGSTQAGTISVSLTSRVSIDLGSEADRSSLHVEEAEDKLVQSTETAIGLMKAVLENVSSVSASWMAIEA